MFPSKQDYTKKGWFSRRKTVSKSNLLYEIIPNFSYWKKFGQNTPDKITYIGKNEYLDRFTGYVLGWDKAHRCDRCGKKLIYRGSYTIRMAYAIKQLPRLKHCGLCSECDYKLEKEKRKDERDGIITSIKKYNSYTRKPIPNTYRSRYIWL